MKPTVQNPDLYQVANDYVQAPLDKFFSPEMEVAMPDGSTSAVDSYQDGIYRQLSDDLTQGEWSAAPWKDPAGFNKRTVLVDPFAPLPTYAPSGESDYSVADVVKGVGPEDPAASAIKPPEEK